MSGHPPTEFNRILRRAEDGTFTLALTAGGKNYHFALTPERLHQLMASGHQVLAEVAEEESA